MDISTHATVRTRSRTRNGRPSRHRPSGKHLALALAALASLFPFYWLVIMATSTNAEVFSFPPRLYPGTRFFTNLGKVVEAVPLDTAFVNSIVVSVSAVLLTSFLCSLGGFVFARMRFKGRDKLFGIVLATMVFPTGVTLAPSVEIYSHLGWMNTFLPLIVPGAASAFGLFWMRQVAISSIPYELIEAARLDGCGLLRTYWHVALPAMRPGLASFGIFSFMWTWNDYMWPLIVLNDPAKYTLPVALAQLKGNYGTIDYSVVMAGTLVAALPLIVLFLVCRKTIFANMMAGALK
ncbi:carbohydrate ABC transporter permease [Streptomyces ipomoeae]|uniref:carbohydrate ABC transporter permease n=1 Tax=Streptomyces ipomoeae TaxID=103232 RepID=UPI0011469C4F|nr:carbohydrate ABC transporter permease [Streptomyces ipomoeae]MDX2939477.1 carbohydrate ABC transporter permease [Streptomyces ipomoeae]TQE25351.1 carbohydrate ABC transporter permease [Streptomyces ipomoeae]